ncbi:MAG: hypothetical protein Kow0075_16120 [Salibacteraceae bacterium]
MKLNVHKATTEQSDQSARLIDALTKELKWFDELKSGSSEPKVEVYLQKSDNGTNSTAVYLTHDNLKTFAEAKGNDPEHVAKQAAYLLRVRYLKKRVENRAGMHTIDPEHLQRLADLHRADDKQQFDFLIKQLLPQLRKFVGRYLKYSTARLKNAFTIDDLMDEIYLALYERYAEQPRNKDEFTAWCYEVAREVVDDYIEQNASPTGEVSIEELASKELRTLEEKFTADAEGDLIMYEELDDISYVNEMSAFQLSKALQITPSEEIATPAVKRALAEYDPAEKLAFELFWLHEMTMNEIARALKMQITEVEHTIDRITDTILTALKKEST